MDHRAEEIHQTKQRGNPGGQQDWHKNLGPQPPVRQDSRAQNQRRDAHRELGRAQQQLGHCELAREVKLTASLGSLGHADIVE
jgi:hypothetical protein